MSVSCQPLGENKSLGDVHIQMDTAVRHSGYELKFTDLCVKIDKREILKDVYGVAKPGEMVAIMGPSGAGKTTLINCLAGRRPIESGTLTLNSRPINKQLKRKISYVLQNDIFLENLTCWETLWYTALLRLPGSMSTSEKKERVMDIVDTLDMRKCLNTKIGGGLTRGLSGGEKKRTTIACELLTNPALMLLDEPTSGLDSSNASSLCTILKQFAKDSGKTVVASIHQPSSQIFNMFDKLLLLCDGKVAYFGEVKNCAQHFASLELPCPANYNLADHILDLVKVSPEKHRELTMAAEKQKEKNFIEMNNSEKTPKKILAAPAVGNDNLGYVIEECGEITLNALNYNNNMMTTPQQKENNGKDFAPEKASGSTASAPSPDCGCESRWPASFFLQFYVLFLRSLKCSYSRLIHKWAMIQMVIFTAFASALWYQVEAKESEITNRQGLMFLAILNSTFSVYMDTVLSVIGERMIVTKERLAGYYRLSAYLLAKNCSDIILHLAISTFFFTPLFIFSGLSVKILVYLKMLGVLCLSCIVNHSLGELFANVFVDLNPAMLGGSTLLMVYMIAGGFYVKSIPPWMKWLTHLSTLFHCFSIVTIIDLSNSQFLCSSPDSLYSSCRTNQSDLFITNQSALSFDNQSALSFTNQSEGNNYVATEELLNRDPLNSDVWTIYHHIFVLVGYVVVLKPITYLLVRFARKPHLS